MPSVTWAGIQASCFDTVKRVAVATNQRWYRGFPVLFTGQEALFCIQKNAYYTSMRKKSSLNGLLQRVGGRCIHAKSTHDRTLVRTDTVS